MNKQYQQMGTDFKIINKKTHKETMVELKTDSYKTGNLFIELTVGEQPGWVKTTQAEHLAYFFPNGQKYSRANLFIVSMVKLKELIENTKLVVKSVAGVFKATGALLPVPLLISSGALITSHQVPTLSKPIINNYLN